MSEPALFLLIRDGEKQCYGDRWAGVFLFRELIWGPDEFEKWVTQLEPIEDWHDEMLPGVVVNFDRRQLVWSATYDQLQIPKVQNTYDRMLTMAWPGYSIEITEAGSTAMSNVADEPDSADDDDQTSGRCITLREAVGRYDDNCDEDDATDSDGDDSCDDDEMDSNDPRAWLTVVDSEGIVRHRQMQQLPVELLRGADGVVKTALQLKAAEVPAEAVVLEGMWIDQKRREIGLWGGPAVHRVLQQVSEGWPGFRVHWSEKGYDEQCQVSGPCGIPMSDADALAKILPIILSTKQFDMAGVMGAIGHGIKGFAIKVTVILVGLMCFPILLFGFFSGSWKPAFITIGVVCLLAVILFKFAEARFKRSFSDKVPQPGSRERPPVAGPLDEPERRRRIGEILRTSGFPPLTEIEPKFAKNDLLEMLS